MQHLLDWTWVKLILHQIVIMMVISKWTLCYKPYRLRMFGVIAIWLLKGKWNTCRECCRLYTCIIDILYMYNIYIKKIAAALHVFLELMFEETFSWCDCKLIIQTLPWLKCRRPVNHSLKVGWQVSRTSRLQLDTWTSTLKIILEVSRKLGENDHSVLMARPGNWH